MRNNDYYISDQHVNLFCYNHNVLTILLSTFVCHPKNSWPNKLKCWLKPVYFNSSIHRLIEKRQPVGITSLRDILKIVIDGEKKIYKKIEELWLLHSLYFDPAHLSYLHKVLVVLPFNFFRCPKDSWLSVVFVRSIHKSGSAEKYQTLVQWNKQTSNIKGE